MAESTQLLEAMNELTGDIPDADEIISHECMLSHHDDTCKDGLYLCLKTYACLSDLFMNIKETKKPKKDTVEEEKGVYLNIRRTTEGANIKRMGVNIENGLHWFRSRYAFVESLEFVVMPGRIRYPLVGLLPIESIVQKRLDAYVNSVRNAFGRRFPSWIEEPLNESKYIDEGGLRLEETAHPYIELNFPMCGYKDGRNKCTQNVDLWLNLSDGFIGCGRTGGGHSLKHYHDTGSMFHLVVKVASITSEGDGIVFSYADKSMVLYPELKNRLKKLNVEFSRKTPEEDRAPEMIWQWNRQIRYDRPLYDLPGCHLRRLESGYTGLLNPHNFCYLNCVIQVLREIFPALNRFDYSKDRLKQYQKSDKKNPSIDVITQLTKLITDLSSLEYSTTGISPVMFQSAIGRHHPEFASFHMKVVIDYFGHLANTLAFAGFRELWNSMTFELKYQVTSEERPDWQEDWTVQQLWLPIVLKKENSIVPGNDLSVFTFEQCLERYFGNTEVKKEDDEHKLIIAKRRGGFASLPDLLLISVFGKQYPDNIHNYEKLNADFQLPEVVDLAPYLYRDAPDGGEEGKVSGGKRGSAPPPEPSDARKLAVEAMLNNPDNQEITPELANLALDKTNDNVQAAIEFYQVNFHALKRVTQKVASVAKAKEENISEPEAYRNEPINYRLVAIIDHISDVINEGHAVAYVRKNTSSNKNSTNDEDYEWLQFDDDRISVVMTDDGKKRHQMPPVKMAQTYILKRIDER